MKRIAFLGFFALSAAVASPAVAQQPLSSGTPVSYDFATFAGTGFVHPATTGRLDSNEWIAIVSSSARIAFGGTGTSGAYANGRSSGGTTTGGVYAFDVDNVAGTTSYALGIQPTGMAFTSGSLQVRATNMTGNTLSALRLSFEFLYYNDQDRSTRMTVRVIRESDGAQITVASLQRDTPAARTGTSWSGAGTPLSADIDLSTIGIPAGGNVIVSFDFDDNPDSTAGGNRDEIALDNVTLSAPTCGNYVVDDGEACDDGNIRDETACPYGVATCTACDATCTTELALTGPRCGDGTLNAADGEACDDGNTVDETGCAYGTASCAGCRADCRASLALIGSFCGDGTLDAADGETCDDGNTVDETECVYGTSSCTLCAADCGSELALTGRSCGDGTLDAADGEACDDGNTVDETGCAYGTPSCMGCQADCRAALSLMGSFCGDGVLDAASGEACDDGNTTSEPECAYGTASCTACADDCASELTLTGRYCGDATVDTDAGEACDDGNMVDGDGCSAGCVSEVDGGVTMTDGGVGADAGPTIDAGLDDAGPNDASTMQPDAAMQSDGGTSTMGGGCGCAVPGRGGAPAPLALLALALGVARIRRRR